jgi:hypothetical protein
MVHEGPEMVEHDLEFDQPIDPFLALVAHSGGQLER